MIIAYVYVCLGFSQFDNFPPHFVLSVIFPPFSFLKFFFCSASFIALCRSAFYIWVIFKKSYNLVLSPVRFDEFNLDMDFFCFLDCIVQIQRDIFSFRLSSLCCCCFCFCYNCSKLNGDCVAALWIIIIVKIAYFQITNQVHKV